MEDLEGTSVQSHAIVITNSIYQNQQVDGQKTAYADLPNVDNDKKEI